MKKSFLLLAVCAMSMTGMAQTKVKANLSAQKIQREATAMNAEQKQGPRKDLASGVYYTRQEGTLFNGMDEQARYYQFVRLYAPAFSDVKFTNMCNNRAAAVWGFNGQQAPEMADENNDLVLTMPQSGNGYIMPEISVVSDTWKLGSSAAYAQYNAIMADTIDYHSFVDQQTGDMYGFGSLSTHYLFGTGTVTPTKGDYAGKTYRSHGIVMEGPAPLAPLYIERFNFIIYNNMESEPIAAGKEVTMQIRAAEYDEEGNRQIGGNILYELKATKADVSDALGSFDTEYSSTGKESIYNLTFSNKTVDPFGTIVDDPIVIDQPFYIIILGHEQEGVNFGYRCVAQPAEDQLVGGTYALAYQDSDPEQTEGYYMWYGSEMVVDMSFYGGYDYVECLAEGELNDGTAVSGINVLRVSADGNTVTNEGAEEALQGNVLFNTAFAWEDADQNINYDVEDMPEWIELVADPQIETGEYSDGTTYDYYNGNTYVTVECEALPAGETGRAVSLYFEGHGAKAKNPLIILQGDATIEDAIENPVVVNTTVRGTYNIAGQKVNKNFKGIVIENGKKSIQK